MNSVCSQGALKILRFAKFVREFLNQIDVLSGITFQDVTNFRTFRRMPAP